MNQKILNFRNFINMGKFINFPNYDFLNSERRLGSYQLQCPLELPRMPPLEIKVFWRVKISPRYPLRRGTRI